MVTAIRELYNHRSFWDNLIMRSEKGRQIHSEASAQLEQGHYLEALKLTDDALMVYQEEKDADGLAEILVMRTLVVNMIGDHTQDSRLYILARHYALASLELAQGTGSSQQIALAHGALARAYDKEKKYKDAGDNFAKARELLSQSQGEHRRMSVIADFRNHSACSYMMAGDASFEPEALAGLADLESSTDASEYEFLVWKSGGLMRLALAWKLLGNKQKSLDYLARADEVAKAEALTVRREQLVKLRKAIEVDTL